MTQQKSKEFNKLQKEWYAKAKASGFEDIENEVGGKEFLYRWSSQVTLKYSPDRYAVKESYYRCAGHFLYDHKFANDLERKIWALHAEGQSVRAIAKALSKEHYKISKWRAHVTVQKLKKIMLEGLRSSNE